MAPFPLVKLAIVFFKQISKPLANQIKVRAKNSEFFKKYICMPPAQFYHWYDVNLRMRMMGIETKKVAKMNEEAAVTLGADILGETVILFIAIAGLGLEYARRSKNDNEKESRHQDRLANMEKQLSELEISLTNQTAQMIQLERLIQHKVSPPSLPASSSGKSAAPPSTGKNQNIQALSIMNASPNGSSLMQLHPIHGLFLPVAQAIGSLNDVLRSSSTYRSSPRGSKQ